MKLKKLLKQIPVQEVKGSREVEITGISSHSRSVAPGNLFVARRGSASNGADYIPEAIGAGAAAILTDIYDPSLKGVTQVIDPDVRRLEAMMAAEFYHHPSRDLFMVGVTGTNGKTTTAFLVKQLLDGLGLQCGLIGTIESIIGRVRYSSTRTTPEVTVNQKVLREMVLSDCKAAVMEVTSHALAQGRTAQISFDVAIYTNLSIDHLDYHGSMADYAAAKARLFASGPGAPHWAIINRDDPWAESMLTKFSGSLLTYSLTDPSADLYADEVELGPRSLRCLVHYQGESVPLKAPLVGRFNLYNLLAAAGVGLIRGARLSQIAPLFSKMVGAEGRLERVANDRKVEIYVDFAHTPDALEQVVRALRETSRGRIITLFGCGGERDRSKRPMMGRIATELSDLTIITSDNPRSEEPEAICREIHAGVVPGRAVELVVDRREAIWRAIEEAKPGDLVLIAGKGHETSQIFAHRTIEFDDREVAREVCRQLQERGISG